MKRLLPLLLGLALCFGVTQPVFADANPAFNSYLGPVGTATMHGDAQSSDTTPHPGPSGQLKTVDIPMLAVCPTVLVGNDHMVVALCTSMFGREPVVKLLDPISAAIVASFTVKKGGLLGGVYSYLDNHDRLVLVDGDRHLIKIAHSKTSNGWQLAIDQTIDISSVLPGDDSIVGLVPDWGGNVVLASAKAKVVVVSPSNAITSFGLGVGESIANSISAAPHGVSIATSHATYLLKTDQQQPAIIWRVGYDRGSARKPGQLSYGTGSTPTFFGPSGDDYLTIVDNADNQENLVVLRTSDGHQICKTPVFSPANSGSENSPIGFNRSVVVANTYGYPYPAVPDGAGASVPTTAPFLGGMQRFNVRTDESGCDLAWSNDLASSAVPRLSLADGKIYTVQRDGADYQSVAIDAATGRPAWRTHFGWGFGWDTLQMVGSITPGTIWQGRFGGITKTSNAAIS